jgi:hypothetical protein
MDFQLPGDEMRGTHLLSICVPQQGVVLIEAQVDRKENEIVVAPKILGNQPRTEWAIQKLFVHEVWYLTQGASLSKQCQRIVRVHKAHGRIENAPC